MEMVHFDLEFHLQQGLYLMQIIHFDHDFDLLHYY